MTTNISLCSRCYFEVGAVEREGFRGDGQTPGCYFAAFNSDISKRCSILHTSRKVVRRVAAFAPTHHAAVTQADSCRCCVQPLIDP
jgi:hypothetical protein